MTYYARRFWYAQVSEHANARHQMKRSTYTTRCPNEAITFLLHQENGSIVFRIFRARATNTKEDTYKIYIFKFKYRYTTCYIMQPFFTWYPWEKRNLLYKKKENVYDRKMLFHWRQGPRAFFLNRVFWMVFWGVYCVKFAKPTLCKRKHFRFLKEISTRIFLVKPDFY